MIYKEIFIFNKYELLTKLDRIYISYIPIPNKPIFKTIYNIIENYN